MLNTARGPAARDAASDRYSWRSLRLCGEHGTDQRDTWPAHHTAALVLLVRRCCSLGDPIPGALPCRRPRGMEAGSVQAAAASHSRCAPGPAGEPGHKNSQARQQGDGNSARVLAWCLDKGQVQSKADGAGFRAQAWLLAGRSPAEWQVTLPPGPLAGATSHKAPTWSPGIPWGFLHKPAPASQGVRGPLGNAAPWGGRASVQQRFRTGSEALLCPPVTPGSAGRVELGSLAEQSSKLGLCSTASQEVTAPPGGPSGGAWVPRCSGH